MLWSSGDPTFSYVQRMSHHSKMSNLSARSAASYCLPTWPMSALGQEHATMPVLVTTALQSKADEPGLTAQGQLRRFAIMRAKA